MSEIDLALVEAFNSHLETMLTIFLGYVSATSAFLVVAHLAATELSTILARFVNSLYSITTLALAGITQRQGEVILGIRSQMGEVLSWHPAVYEPAWVLVMFMRSPFVVMVLIYAGSIWYFRYARNKVGTSSRTSGKTT